MEARFTTVMSGHTGWRHVRHLMQAMLEYAVSTEIYPGQIPPWLEAPNT